jgi:hypothetical protein
MVPDVPGHIARAPRFYTLHPGDVKHLEFEKIGAMDVPVRAAL